MPKNAAPTDAIDLTDDNGPMDFTTGAIDFNSVSTEFEPNPEGIYPATVVRAEITQSQSGPHPYIAVEMDLDSGGKAWTNLSFSPKALFRMKKALVAMGVDMSKPLTPQETCDAMINCRVDVHLVIENYTKRDNTPGRRNSVKELYAEGHGEAIGAAPVKSSSW